MIENQRPLAISSACLDSAIEKVLPPTVEWVAVPHSTSVIAWNAQTDSLHLLDNVTGVIFQTADAKTPLRETISELADAHDEPVNVIAQAVLKAIGQLLDHELIEICPPRT